MFSELPLMGSIYCRMLVITNEASLPLHGPTPLWEPVLQGCLSSTQRLFP